MKLAFAQCIINCCLIAWHWKSGSALRIWRSNGAKFKALQHTTGSTCMGRCFFDFATCMIALLCGYLARRSWHFVWAARFFKLVPMVLWLSGGQEAHFVLAGRCFFQPNPYLPLVLSGWVRENRFGAKAISACAGAWQQALVTFSTLEERRGLESAKKTSAKWACLFCFGRTTSWEGFF